MQRNVVLPVAATGAECERKRVVVVGGGWAGFGAAHSLAKAGCSVTVLDAAPTPGGLSTGFRTAQGRAVEAGIKGFWWQYHNIFQLVRELGIPWPFTDWTRSTFYSPDGIVVESPVFNKLPRLPAPLGTFLYTAPLFRNLPLADRLSALPLLKALVEFDTDEVTYRKYDAMTARELFQEGGVSRRLFREFLEPILYVSLFAPAERLSAAATLGALYYYVLAHQADFDVCWCKGPINEAIFKPWVQDIQRQGGVILERRRVNDVITGDDDDTVSSVVAVNKDGVEEIHHADAVVFAVGVQAMQRVVASSTTLAARREFSDVMNIGTVDVVAGRIWLDKRVPLRTPSNVLAGFDSRSGATLFDLNSFQADAAKENLGVVEVDIFHANHLLPLDDEAVVKRIMDKYLRKCDNRYSETKVVDYSVVRLKGGVTLFGPNSHQFMPKTNSSFSNVFIAGDWLRQGPGTHGARGLSQEKAYVTGLLAAKAAAERLGVSTKAIQVLDVEEDEPHIAAAKAAVTELKRALTSLGVTSSPSRIPGS